MAPHTSSATPEQIDTLLNFLEEHKDLALGRLRGGDGNAQAKRLWAELSEMLNCMGGCTKSVQQWQKVWFDRKHLAKKAAADARRLASGTGGGPSMAPPLSHWQLKILSIMGDGFGERQTGARVPAFSQPELPLVDAQLSPERSQPSLQVSQPPVSAPSLTLSSQPTRRRRSAPASDVRSRRRAAPASDFRSRLFRYEEGRVVREAVRNAKLGGIKKEVARMNTTLTNTNIELAGISATLTQLCGLVKECLDYMKSSSS